MLFGRRETPPLRERLKRLLWPRTSFVRSARYVWKRLFRLNASPHKIGVGVAAGVFASITPLIGVQMMMAGVLAVILRGSVAAAMLATFVGNPVTWPLFWAATYGAGTLVLGGEAVASSLATGAPQHWQIVYTMLIGSIPVGLLAAALSYRVTVRAVGLVRSGHRPAKGAMARSAARPGFVGPAWRLW